MSIDIAEAKNFDPATGFQTDGKQDIGAYNGPLGLVEFEKAAHLFFNTVALCETVEKLEPERSYYMPWFLKY